MTEAQEDALKDRLFGSATDIPRTLVALLVKRQAAEWEIFVVVRDDPLKEEFRVYWLDGQLVRSITYSGKENSASAHELAYPLSTLSSVKTTYTLLNYDGYTRRHERWTRVVTVHFRDEEPIVFENVREDSNVGQFVDAVLGAVAGAYVAGA